MINNNEQKNKRCQECKKQITSGKYYIYRGFLAVEMGAYHPSCFEEHCRKESGKEAKKLIADGYFSLEEREIRDKTSDELTDFEEKWKEYELINIFKRGKEKEIIDLAWLQAARKDLEPYLQKPDIVEKSFGGSETKGNVITFYYWFSKSAQDEDYLKQVVNPTATEILGGKPDPEITNSELPQFGKGIIVNGNKAVYNWIEGSNYRLLEMNLQDRKLALQSYCRALKIKEKELKGKENPWPSNSLKKPSEPAENKPTESRLGGKTIALLATGGIIIFGLAFFLLMRRKIKNAGNQKGN